MKQLIKFLIIFFITSATSQINAEDLLALYMLAQDNDPIMQAAAQSHLAQLENLPQARALLLPTVTANSGATQYNSNDPSKNYNTWAAYSLNITQPIFQMTAWSKLSQANDSVKLAFANLADAKQALLFRVSQQYFTILEAADNLHFAKAAQKAFAKQLEQAKQRHQVGLIAITDVLEAQAAYDNSSAAVIAADNDLTDTREQLRIMVGRNIKHLAALQAKVNMLPPNPTNTAAWIKLALEKNWALQAARYNLAVAKKQIFESRASNYPTVQLTANMARLKNYPTARFNKSTDRNIGVALSLPLFNGGGTLAKTRQAAFNYEKTKHEIEGKTRETESRTRKAYNGILTSLSRIKALQQAVISNTSALKATQAAFEVGNRTIVDVLNAQKTLINAEKDFAKARYNYIMQSLTLKQVTGILSIDDLQEINTWLKNSL